MPHDPLTRDVPEDDLWHLNIHTCVFTTDVITYKCKQDQGRRPVDAAGAGVTDLKSAGWAEVCDGRGRI